MRKIGYTDSITWLIAHEGSHLLGYQHDEGGEDRDDGLLGSVADITTLSWRSGNTAGAGVVTSANPGQTVYLRADGAAGTYTVQIYEEEDFYPPDATDDLITTRTITIGSSGYGFASWTVSASAQDEASPRQTFYVWWDKPWSIYDVESARLKINPDLQIIDMRMNGSSMPSSTSSAPTVRIGDSVRLDFLAKNNGPGSAGTSARMEWYYGTSSESTTNYIDYGLLGTINGLAPGETEWETDASWTIPILAPGTYYLTAFVDPSNTFPETNENNNKYSRPFKVIAPEVEVLGNAVVIADGDTTPSTSDHTNFGSVTQGGSTISRTFT